MAMVPASRAASRSKARSSVANASVVSSASGKGHAFDKQRRSCHAEIAVDIAGRLHREEHSLQVCSDRYLRHRIGKLAILDPEAGGAATIFAGHHVYALANDLRYVKAGFHRSYHVLRTGFAGLYGKVG